jgi:hypothetical protein
LIYNIWQRCLKDIVVETPAFGRMVLLLAFYALYYGVLARDLAEMCAERMAFGIGVG